MLHGFRWPRAGFTGIRVYIVLHNLEEAAAEYIQQPLTTELLKTSFRKTQADLVTRLPELSFIEQYDPADETSGTVSQDYAYISTRVLEISEDESGDCGGENIEDYVEQGSGLTHDQTAALEELRDRLAPGEKIGWYLVYNGDPERWFPDSEDSENYESEEDSEDESQNQRQGQVQSRKGESSIGPTSPQSYTNPIQAVSLGNMGGGASMTGATETIQSLSQHSPSGFINADQVTSWLSVAMVLSFIIVQNRQGKTRLAKWYSPYSDEEKIKLKGEVHRLVAPRDQKYQSNFVEFRRSTKVVYRRYAGLFFCVCVDANDNELAYLEAIHFFVEVLDQFFGNVCELDLVFNFYKVYAILDEVFLAGEIQETSKQVVLTRLEHLDKLE
ncbi:AP-2 complex subunit sigma [Penicillium digitatum PHI26]|uniref:AP-2 complex subunit sigma n=2 Tax=Penicillium digitatum TaxID=36651 RepID=K9G9U8_PEND2|nr:AP-2 complex subunit sigma [Penicillium digitatum Pd1]EKV08561.1 AP-2 complex subunit sigma [Penicillium digitatum Pd1]EKV10071.1 AP-2 complex subunit sigma [Penicillium digitatum PHI26]